MLYVKFGSVIGSVPIRQQLDDQYRLPKIDIWFTIYPPLYTFMILYT